MNNLNSPIHAYQARYAAIQAMDIATTVPVLLAGAEERFGHAPAIDFFEAGQSMSFALLAATARRLAHGLHGLGVGKGTHVGVLLPNRIDYPVIWLALAELGAIIIPLVLKSTPRELAFFVTDGAIDYFITSGDILAEKGMEPGQDGLPPVSRVILLDGGLDGAADFGALVDAGNPGFQAVEPPGSDDVLSIQYTSGTTGLPKGVMLTHRYWTILGALTLAIWDRDIRSLLNAGPFFYMDAPSMLFAALHHGARLDVADRSSVAKRVRWLRDRRTELAWFTNPILKQPAVPEERELAIKLFMGEHMTPAMIRNARARFNAPIREAYGMTEIGMTLCVPLEVEDEEALGTCGVPAPFRQCRVVDTDGNDVPNGKPGELWVTGEGILKGYYNRPEANEASFSGSWFRTGDLFVRDAKGYYRIIGRLKHMIRRSGENIAASEVEAVLMELPQVTLAAVVPVPDEHRGEEVKAFVQLSADCDPEQATAILDHCRARLAPFKVPRFIAFVDEFPYTASGKIATQQLTHVQYRHSPCFDAANNAWTEA